MVWIRDIGKEFVDEQKNYAESMIQDICYSILDEYDNSKKKIYHNFNDMIIEMNKSFEIMYQNKQVTELRFVKISYMRTNILTREPLYRINMYDEQYIISDVDFYMYWDAKFIYSKIHDLQDELIKRFNKQSKARMYEVDKIIVEITDEINKLSYMILYGLLSSHFRNNSHYAKLYYDNKVKFNVGEFMDNDMLFFDFECN